MLLPKNNNIAFKEWWNKINARRDSATDTLINVKMVRNSRIGSVLESEEEWNYILTDLRQSGLITHASVKEYLARRETSRLLQSKKPEGENTDNTANKGEHSNRPKILQKLNGVCRPQKAKKKQSLFDNHETFLSLTSKNAAEATKHAILRRRSSEGFKTLERVPCEKYLNCPKECWYYW